MIVFGCLLAGFIFGLLGGVIAAIFADPVFHKTTGWKAFNKYFVIFFVVGFCIAFLYVAYIFGFFT